MNCVVVLADSEYCLVLMDILYFRLCDIEFSSNYSNRSVQTQWNSWTHDLEKESAITIIDVYCI